MSQMLKWAVAGVAAVAMTSVVCAQAQAASTMATDVKAGVKIVKSVFQKIDTNIDGKLTAIEQQARLKEWFKELDANGDGKVSPAEFVGQRFVNIDVNKDGTVTMEEYLVFFAGVDAAADKTVACDKLDANGDNAVTPVEVVAYRKSVFKATDADGHGKATPADLKAAHNKQFKRLDANKDGFVTVEEMVAIIAVPATTAPKAVEKKAEKPAKK